MSPNHHASVRPHAPRARLADLHGLSGEVHYWRLDPACWARVLDAVASLGFRTIATYIPWCVHEDGPGEFSFGAERDVVGFCELAAARGLRVIVRIGPDTGAELETSGWPRRVVDDPACQARRADGRPYLLVSATHHFFPPSYASRRVLDEVARWYDAVVARLAPLQAPDGPVVACQVDNEMGYHFQSHPYAMDYHPDAVAAYRVWLAARYRDIGELNDAYGTQHDDFGAVEPPADGTDEPELRRLDWLVWREQHRRDAVSTFATWARDRGIRVPVVHNDYPRLTTPMDLGALEASGAVDVATADVYTTKEGAGFAADVVRHLCGSSRHPWLQEIGAGWLTLPWLLPLATTADDVEHVTLRALASGARMMNVYMLVERDRWYGSPISRTGEIREPLGTFYRRLNELIETSGIAGMRREAPVLLVENRTESRRTAARSRLGTAVPCFSQLYPLDMRLTEPDDPDRDELRRWEAGFAAALAEAGVDHDRASSSSLPDLRAYEVVLMPTLDAIDAGVWGRLREAAGGGVRVGMGPRVPSLDERLQPHAFSGEGVDVLADPADVAKILPDAPFGTSAPVDVHVWRGEDRTLVFAFNRTPKPVAHELDLGDARPLWGDGPTLPGWGVGVWELRA